MKISRLCVRFILEVAWQAHFVKNMFIRPKPEELIDFKPDFVVLNASKATNPDWKKQGLNSENFIFFNLTDHMAIIGGTWYGGEMKKGVFSLMNYYLPLKGIASMHCSANVGKNGDTAYSSDCQEPEKQPFQLIMKELLSAMMSTAGMMRVYLILREAVMPNASG